MLRLTACSADLRDGRVERDGRSDHLTEMERKLLAYLVEHAARDVPREELLTEVWGYSASAMSRTVTATVHRLRAKIERDPSEPDHVTTVWGCGFRFEPLAPLTPPTRPDLDRFFGRQALIGALGAELGPRRLVTLLGPGGIGKTRLARELLAAVERSAAWVDVGPEPADQLLLGLARAMGLRLASRDELVRAVVERGPLLLVLDNVEASLDAVAGLVGVLLAAAPDLTVVCTSQAPLRLAGEVVHTVGPLDPDDARALFRDRMPPGVPIDEAALDGVLEPLDGMPLAIELAARLTEVLPAEALTRRLGRPLDLLTEDRRDRPERHRSLRAALTDAFGALDEPEQDALAWLSVIRGAFDAADAEALLGPPAIARIRALLHRSLLQRQPHGHRLLAPVRAFAAEHLAGLGHASDARAAWTSWLAEECGRRFDPAGPPPSGDDGDWADRHLGDLRAAWEHALTTAPGAAASLASALHTHHALNGPLAASAERLDRTLRLPLPPPARGHLLRYLGHARAAAHDAEGAIAAGRAALEIAEQIGDTLLEGRVCSFLVSCDVDGEPEGPTAQRARRAHEAAGDEAGLATTLGVIASRHRAAGRLDEAVAIGERAARLHLQHDNLRSAAICLNNLAMASTELGDDTRAGELLREALEHAEVARSRREQRQSLALLGQLALIEERFEDAAELWAEAARLTRHLGSSPIEVAHMTYRQGIALAWAGQLPAAAATLEDAARAAERAQDSPFWSLPLARGWVDLLQGDPTLAEAALAGPVPDAQTWEATHCDVLRALLLAMLHDGGRAPTGRSEVLDLLPDLRARALHEQRLGGTLLFVRELEGRLSEPPAG